MKQDRSRQVGNPEPGFFETRLVKKGPKVAAKITFENDIWQATVNGEVFPGHADPTKAKWVLRIWEGSDFIDEARYKYLLALKEWALANDRDHPAANPRRPIDLNSMKPLW